MTKDKWDKGQCTLQWIEVKGKHYPAEVCQDPLLENPPTLTIENELKCEVPEAYREQLLKLSQESGIPYVVAVNLLHSESGLDFEAISPTGARGIGQLYSGALYERLIQERENLPPHAQKIVDENIEIDKQPLPNGKLNFVYQIKDGGSEAAVKALAHDPSISLQLAFKHMEFSIKEGIKIYRNTLEGRLNWMEKKNHIDNQDFLNSPGIEDFTAERAVEILEEKAEEKFALLDRTAQMREALTRPITAADLKVLYVCGATGGAQLLEALADPVKRAQNHAALDYAPERVVEANKSLFYKDVDRGIKRTIVEFHDHMASLVGTEPIPQLGQTSAPQEAIASNIPKP